MKENPSKATPAKAPSAPPRHKGMSGKKVKPQDLPERLSFNLGIVGGGRTCMFFLELLKKDLFPHLNIKVAGVSDINPEAEGFQLAGKMGIYTTRDFRDILNMQNLDAVLEVTDSPEVHDELIRLRPKGLGILEHNVGRLLRTLSWADQGIKSAEQKAELEKGVSAFLIQQANERIVFLNPDFTIIDANEPYVLAANRTRDQVTGAFCYEVTHGLDQPCASSDPDLGCPLVETLRTGLSAHVIHEHPGADGQTTYCDIMTYPIRDKGGKIERIIEVWRDITKEIAPRVEARMVALKSDLAKVIQEDRLISLGKLVASSVHEINNPIQGLLTFAALMKDTLDKKEPSREDLDQFRYYVSLMTQELERCGKIISGLLSFARQTKHEFKELDLGMVLEQVIALTRHKMEMQRIQLSTSFDAYPLIVTGDMNQLQQCFLNLIFNAIEAMPNGGQLSLRTEQDPGGRFVQLEIRDTGVGIPKEHLDHVFDPFFTTKNESEGTGLGLSIVHGVVKAHRGKIQVESKPGQGTLFVLTFPVR